MTAASLRFHIGWRVLIAIALGVAAIFVPIPGFVPALDGTFGWVVGVTAFLVLTRIAIGDGSPRHARERARALDASSWGLSIAIVVAATVSLVALAYVFRMPGGPAAARYGLACVAVVLSWILMHTMFALHYAHRFYGDPEPKSGRAERGGLTFPGELPPDYWDFLYYSLVVGMTCQVSDVQITSRAMRRLTLVHGVLSFFFNTGVLALAVNVIAGAL
jgi:uncharacterized membrane protein